MLVVPSGVARRRWRGRGSPGDEPDAGSVADLGGVHDPGLDGEHLAVVYRAAECAPDAATVTTDQTRGRFDAFGWLHTRHHPVREERIEIRSTCVRTRPAFRADGGIDAGG